MQDKKIPQSTYQDYNKASQAYDSHRIVVGLQQIVSALKTYSQNSKIEKVVDIGCGTGNYLLAMTQQYQSATGVEPNQGMLSKFASKVKELKLEDKITLVNSNAQDIPLPDASFDAAIATLTIHHHGSKENKQKFLNQVYRLLKPGGVFVINHIYDQTLKAQWNFHFNKKIWDTMNDKCGSKELMIELGENAGLKFKEMVPIKQFFGGEEKQKFLTKEGRSTVSIFALLTEEEDLAFEQWAKDLILGGKLDEFIKENCQQAIDTVGYSANFVFTKENSK